MSIDFLNRQLKLFLTLSFLQRNIIRLLREYPEMSKLEIAQELCVHATTVEIRFNDICRRFDIDERGYDAKRAVLLSIVNLVFASPYKL